MTTVFLHQDRVNGCENIIRILMNDNVHSRLAENEYTYIYHTAYTIVATIDSIRAACIGCIRTIHMVNVYVIHRHTAIAAVHLLLLQKTIFFVSLFIPIRNTFLCYTLIIHTMRVCMYR